MQKYTSRNTYLLHNYSIFNIQIKNAWRLLFVVRGAFSSLFNRALVSWNRRIPARRISLASRAWASQLHPLIVQCRLFGRSRVLRIRDYYCVRLRVRLSRSFFRIERSPLSALQCTISRSREAESRFHRWRIRCGCLCLPTLILHTSTLFFFAIIFTTFPQSRIRRAVWRSSRLYWTKWMCYTSRSSSMATHCTCVLLILIFHLFCDYAIAFACAVTWEQSLTVSYRVVSLIAVSASCSADSERQMRLARLSSARSPPSRSCGLRGTRWLHWSRAPERYCSHSSGIYT